MKKITIAIDGEGGDNAPNSVITALAWGKKYFPDVEWLVHCTQANQKAFKKIGIEPIVCPDGETSTLKATIQAVKENKAEACISAGNTIFYVIESIKNLKKLPGIKRPALISSMPSQPRDKILVDIGANIQCSAYDLTIFALMGRIYSQEIFDRTSTSVSFMNVGTEAIKGPAYIREAKAFYNQIFEKEKPADFIEGDALFIQDTDVVVMDGYTGNVLIKFAAGLSSFFFNTLKAAANKSILNKIRGLFAKKLFKSMKNLDHHNHNSAILMGFDKLVIKAHGNSNAKAYATTLEYAVKMCQKKDTIQSELKKHTEHLGKIAL